MAGFFNPQGFLTAVQQEITRAHKGDSWALDSVVLHAEVTDLALEQVRHHAKEGVYVHGLFLDGAAWEKVGHDGSLVESAPKKLFSLLPVIMVTAITKASKKTVSASNSYGPHGPYECPVYKYPARTDRYLIFSVLLASINHKPLHWTLRGVALLCSTN
jgi:dynein heavy chain